MCIDVTYRKQLKGTLSQLILSYNAYAQALFAHEFAPIEALPSIAIPIRSDHTLTPFLVGLEAISLNSSADAKWTLMAFSVGHGARTPTG